MGAIQNVVDKNDIATSQGFTSAMKDMVNVSEGEIRFLLTFDPVGQTSKFKKQQALAKAELGRRAYREQKKLTWITASMGLVGVVVGAVLQATFNSL